MIFYGLTTRNLIVKADYRCSCVPFSFQEWTTDGDIYFFANLFFFVYEEEEKSFNVNKLHNVGNQR